MCTCILNILHGLECSSSSLTCSSSLFLFSHILFYTSTAVGSLLKRNIRWICWVRYRPPWKMCKIHEFRNLLLSQRQCKGEVEWCINSNCHAAMNRQRRRSSRVYFSAFEKCKVQSEVNIEITTPREEFFSSPSSSSDDGSSWVSWKFILLQCLAGLCVWSTRPSLAVLARKSPSSAAARNLHT